MKVAFTNFFTTLRRYKTASVLNIAGLTLAFIAFYILMAQVHHGLMYNSTIPDYERVYVTIFPDQMSEFYNAGAPAHITEKTIEQTPEVEAGGVLSLFTHDGDDIYKLNGGQYECYKLKNTSVTVPVLQVLGIEMVAGDLEQLKRPGTILISDYAARKTKLGIGDEVYNGELQSDGSFEEQWSSEIVGIYKAFDSNSILSEAHLLKSGEAINSLYHYGQTGIIKLREGADPAKFEELWRENYKRELIAKVGEGVLVNKENSARLVSLKDFYFSPYKIKEDGISLGCKQGNLATTYSLMAVAILTVLIAFINFVNFFFALIPQRIRAVNISKVFGATNRSLRWSFLFEALALTLISLGLALYLMIAVQDTPIANFVSCSLALKDNIATIGWILFIVVVLALTAALYPAWYITSFSPSLAAKGRFGGSKAGQRLRLVLSVVQFSISMALIIITLAFWLQYRYMTTYDMGFDYENVVTFHWSSKSFERNKQLALHNATLFEELGRIPMVEDITMTQRDMFKPTMNMSFSVRAGSDEMITLDAFSVRYNFLQFFHIPVIGRGFLPDDNEQYVIESKLLDKLSAGNNRVPAIENAAGFISGCRFRSLNRPDVYYKIQGSNKVQNMRQFYLRLHPTADYPTTIEYIKNVLVQLGHNPATMKFERVEDQIADMYAETRNQTVLMSLFSVLSIVISLMGVFGIVIFETQYRRREIAIRRVFGATTSGMIWMFNSRYVQIVGACFLIATPVAYFVIDEWQKDFAYKAPIGVWVYVVALAAIALLTLALVSYRSYRAANENPAQVVKGE